MYNGRRRCDVKSILKILTFCFAFALLSNTNSFAQRYSHDNALGGIENVKFVAQRNGGTIEFTWNIQTTREITAVEFKRGIINNDEEITWEVIKAFDPSESAYTDYDPSYGKLYYKLVLIGKDGTAREYEPKYLVKGKS